MVDFEFEGEFEGTGIFQTESIDLNTGVPVVSAKVMLNQAAVSGSLFYFLTNDGGVTWHPVNVDESHTFDAPGNDLRLRIVGTIGSSISIRQPDGSDYPIKVIKNV